VRLRQVGRWERDAAADLAVACAASVAAEKLLAEVITRAHEQGRSWPEIALVLGLSPQVRSRDDLLAELMESRRWLWGGPPTRPDAS
jgi:hypothetical protein